MQKKDINQNGAIACQNFQLESSNKTDGDNIKTKRDEGDNMLQHTISFSARHG